VRLRLTLERGGATQVLRDTQKVLSPGRSYQSEHVPEWQTPELSDGQLSTDGKVLAVVLGGKPTVFTLAR
jgi:hypothetical protein